MVARRRRRLHIRSAYLVISVVVILLSVLYIWRHTTENRRPPDYEEGTLRVHYLDVGQADSTFIQLPNGETMLIDAGTNNMADRVISYLQDQGVETIDYLVGTHPHVDHIGGLDEVIKAFDIEKFYMPWVSHNSRAFERVLDAAEDKSLTVTTARAGVVLYEDEELSVTMVAPVSESYSRMNDYSAVVLLRYRERGFIFMADAEHVSEGEITADVDVDVLRMGHHGSHSSNSQEFFDRVDPQYAVISVGKDNPYGHPAVSVLKMLQRARVTVYRTDADGNIVCDSDGEDLDFYHHKPEENK